LPFLRVPERYRDGLRIIGELPDDAFSEIYNALKSAPSGALSYTDLAKNVSGEIKGVPAEQVRRVLHALTSLYRLTVKGHVSGDVLANQLYDAIREEGRNLVSDGNQARFRDRIARSLSLESLNVVASKAAELRGDFERRYCESSILRVLRHVFGDVSSAPTAMVIVHTLKLVYHEGPMGEHKELYIAIDSDDIAKLQEMLNRAETKARSLISGLQTSGIKFVEPT
jgi:hypothetical protein